MSAGGRPSTDGRRRAAWRGATIGLLAVLAIGAVASFQVSPYVGRRSPGFSFDTPYYVWRTKLVAIEGTPALAAFPPATNGNGDRPGFPALGAVLTSVTGVDALTFVILIRAIAAIAIGAAAAGVAIAAIGSPPWSLPLFLVGLGSSAAITGTAIGSLENLMADVPLMALAGAATFLLDGRPARWSIPLLIAAAGVVHWVFAGLFIALLVAVGLVSALLARPEGGVVRQLRRTAVLVGLLVAGGALAVALVVALPDTAPPVVVRGLGNVRRVPLYELPVLLPLALAGFAISFPRASPTAKTTLSLFGLWAASVPVALAISIWIPQPLRLFRIASFALGVPVLVVVGLVVAIAWGARRWRIVGAALGICLAVAVLAIALPPQVGPFSEGPAAQVTRHLEDARSIGRYLSDLDPSRGVVIVSPGRGPVLDRTMRAGVPAGWIHGTRIYLGDPADLLRGRPTSDPSHPKLSAISREWWAEAWPDARAVLARDPILIGRGVPASSGASGPSLAPDVVVLRGPPPEPADARRTPIDVPWSRALWLCVAILGIVTAIGFAWARALFAIPWLAALALAPAVGIAVLIVAGSAAGRLGIAPGGRVGVALAVGALIAGIAAWAWRIAVDRRAAGPTVAARSDRSGPGA